jgi:hypothetical protein
MSRLIHRQLCLRLTLLMCFAVAKTAQAQPAALTAPSPIPGASSAPTLQPPLAFFRELLAMPPEQREKRLAQSPPEKRAALAAKIAEYEAMTPQRRDQTLWATELYWYLQLFILQPLTNSSVIQLSQVPEVYREAVSNQLMLWKLLPPPLKQEVLSHETTRDFFLLGARVSPSNNVPPHVPPQMLPPPLRQELLHLEVLPSEQRKQTYAHFQSFFELDAVEKQSVLNTLPVDERQHLQKVVAGLNRMTPKQRETALKSLAQVAELSDEQRQSFFKNFGRWQQLSPEERQVWLKLASLLPPMPPLPPLPPPVPPVRSPTLPNLSSATNP